MRAPILLATLLLVTATANPAVAQIPLIHRGDVDRVNRRIAGRILDYTNKHGDDRRLYSPILGMKRDLYVYLPPGYDPRRAYPLVIYLHSGFVDEHVFVRSGLVEQLDGLIRQGSLPPMIVACPDGLYTENNDRRDPHSLFMNGLGGAFENHIVYEVYPFLTRCFSVRPEREAHGLLGASAGGFGAMSLALRHRDYFGAVATLAAPLNLRYGTCSGDYFEDFDPARFRWSTVYDPNQVVGRFYFGLYKVRARKYISPVFGEGPEVVGRIMAVNPADLLSATALRPGELAIYVNYPALDNFNFDAQDQSFAWLAGLQGVDLTIEADPVGRHDRPYFRRNHWRAFLFLGRNLLPPI